MVKRQTITAIVPAADEEKNINRCIKSLTWCDKVQVLWMGSDSTGEIAQKLGAQVVIRNTSLVGDWVKVQKNINWAIDNCSTDWILRVDADEEVPPALRDEILSVVSGNSDANAYGLPRSQYFFGGFLKGGDWAYDRLVRLFRPRFARYEPIVPIHEQLSVKGKTGFLKNRLNHYSHPTLEDAINKFNLYSSLETPTLRKSRSEALFNLIIQPSYIFLRWMIWHQGIRDGLRGLIAGAYRACYEFMIWSKYLESLNRKRQI